MHNLLNVCLELMTESLIRQSLSPTLLARHSSQFWSNAMASAMRMLCNMRKGLKTPL